MLSFSLAFRLLNVDIYIYIHKHTHIYICIYIYKFVDSCSYLILQEPEGNFYNAAASPCIMGTQLSAPSTENPLNIRVIYCKDVALRGSRPASRQSLSAAGRWQMFQHSLSLGISFVPTIFARGENCNFSENGETELIVSRYFPLIGSFKNGIPLIVSLEKRNSVQCSETDAKTIFRFFSSMFFV